MTIEELKKMIAENISIDEDGEDVPVIFFDGKKLKNIVLSEENDSIDNDMPFHASETTIEDSIITGRAYKDMYLSDKITFENVIVKDVDLSDPQIVDCNFYNCIFENITFPKYGYIKKSDFEGCLFINCSFNKIDLLDDSFCLCNFEACNFKECDFKDSCFNETKMYDITLNNCKNIEFSDSLMIEANN